VLLLDDEQKERFLGPFSSLIVHAASFALTDPGGGSNRELQDRATPRKAWVLTGECFIAMMPAAPMDLGAGQCGAGEGPSVSVRFLEQRTVAWRFKIERKMGSKHRVHLVHSQECRIPEKQSAGGRRAARNPHL